MTAIPFPKTSAPGQRPHESAGRLINAYHEALVAGATSEDSWRRAPGLKRFATTSNTGWRGAILTGNDLYAAWSGSVARYDSTGAETSVGTLAGTKNVTWAVNNKSPTPDIVVVDPDNGASVVTSSSVASYPDADLPAVNSVTFLDGYFFFSTGDGRCFASALNDTAINALDEVGAQGKRDGLIRVIAFADLYMCGQLSIEIYHDTAEATGFPFSRVTVIPKGLLGPYAISGFEDGMGKGIIFVGDDKRVYALNGYSPTAISTPDVDRALASFMDGGGDVNDIEMFPYSIRGHSCIALKTPSWTWVFDIDTIHWHERRSHLIENWRATQSIFAFNKWLCGDHATGNIQQITGTIGNEDGDPLPFFVESGAVSAFPNRVAVPEATFSMARGVGMVTGTDPSQTDPSVNISWSDDAGMSWSVPRILKLGRQQLAQGPLRLPKTGMTHNEARRWRVVVYDDVDVILTGGDMQGEARR
jgi:hypothetical protein